MSGPSTPPLDHPSLQDHLQNGVATTCSVATYRAESFLFVVRFAVLSSRGCNA